MYIMKVKEYNRLVEVAASRHNCDNKHACACLGALYEMTIAIAERAAARRAIRRIGGEGANLGRSETLFLANERLNAAGAAFDALIDASASINVWGYRRPLTFRATKRGQFAMNLATHAGF